MILAEGVNVRRLNFGGVLAASFIEPASMAFTIGATMRIQSIATELRIHQPIDGPAHRDLMRGAVSASTAVRQHVPTARACVAGLVKIAEVKSVMASPARIVRAVLAINGLRGKSLSL